MDKDDNLISKTKDTLKTIALTKKIVILAPFIFLIFILIYGILDVEIDMEAVDCLIVKNCDASQAEERNKSKTTPILEEVASVKEQKKNSLSEVKAVAGLGHKAEVFQPISDVEIENLGAQMYQARQWLIDQELEEPAEMYGKVPKTSLTIGSVDTTDMDHWEMAMLASQQTGWHPLFIISQWQLETGHFTSNNYRVNNNIAGQTWTPSSQYPKGTARPKNEGGWYIKYPNPVEGYVHFVLNNPRYGNVKNLKTPEEQAREVAKQGWAVDPLYASKLIQMIEKNRGKFGEGSIPPPQTESESKDAGASVPATSEPNADGDKVVQEAYRMYETRGINSANPMRYSMTQRAQEAFADCSEFVQMVYKKALGVDIGSTTIGQIEKNAAYFNTDRSQLKPGDLVYFNSPGGHGHTRTINGQSVTVDHTGIYVGDNKYIDMSSGTNGIAIKDIGPGGKQERYFNNSFIGFIRVGTPGTGNITTGSGTAGSGLFAPGEQFDEEHVQLRALINTDWYAIDEEEIFQLDEKGKKYLMMTHPGIKGEIKQLKPAYKDSAVEDTYLIAMAIKTDPDGHKRLTNYIGEKRYKNWDERDWMLNVRFLVYNCYLVGDDTPYEGGTWSQLKEWIAGIFEDGPCESLNKYWGSVTENPKAVYIKEDDQYVLNHMHKRIEYTYVCNPPPPPPEEEEDSGGSGANNSGSGANNGGGKGIVGPRPIPLKATQRGTASYANHIKVEIGKDSHSCVYGVKQVDKQEYLYPSYPSLYSGAKEKSVLKNFEKYSLIMEGVNVVKGETYATELERVLRMFYGDTLDQNESSMLTTIGGGTDFIVPMEDGTYNYSSAFRSSHRPTHNGVDMGTRGVTGVPIYSTSNGTVVSTGWVNGYGYTVMIQHTNGYYSFYAHMLEDYIVVKTGQTVRQAQLVGGVDGVPDLAEHLHFEVCERAVESASGNLMCADHVDPEDDDNSTDGRPDDVKLSFNPSQDMNKSRTSSTKFLNEWKEKAKSGNIFIMPGFSSVTGSLSQGFESKDGGCVNHKEDAGGMSCGQYQFANNQQAVCAFVNWMGDNGYSDYYNVFASYCPSGVTRVVQENAFMSTWNGLKTGADYPMDFKNAQHIYAKSQYYDPVAAMVKKDYHLDVNTRHVAVQEMVWSIGVQHWSQILDMFKQSGYSKSTDWSKVTDREIIEKIYQARYDGVPKYFPSSPKLWDSLRNRFQKEKIAALGLLGGS